MGGPGVTAGARALLFDRLVQPQPHEPRDAPAPLRVLDRAGLEQSLQQELERLLNTRCPYPAGALAGGERTVIEYGLPDYSAMYTQNPEDQARLAALVRSTVEAFEPRLREVRVEVQILNTSERELLVKVSGLAALGRLVEPVSFVVNISGEGASHGR